jgi:hypothetical protein
MATHRLSSQITYLENIEDNISDITIEDSNNLPRTDIKNNNSNKLLKLEKIPREKKELPNICLNYADYKKENVNLNKYKLPELKSICKQHKLMISGTKPILIERILTFFKQIDSCIIIQKYFRRYIVYWCLRKRGAAFKNRKLCINETDGYTLEPLDEIPMERFFSFSDSKGFIYGFDIVTLYNTSNKNVENFVNPYTREKVEENIIRDIFFIFNTTKILFEYVFSREEKESIFIKKHIENLQQGGSRRSRNRQIVDTTLGHNYNEPIYYGMHFLVHLNLQQKEILDKIIQTRTYEIDRRIEDVISEINQLGNYASSRWILDLNQSKIFTFMRILRDIWDYRFGISPELKNNICSFGDPFSILHLRSLSLYRFDMPQFVNLCMDLIYYFVCSGKNIEFRKLGAMYVLTALTCVSNDGCLKALLK